MDRLQIIATPVRFLKLTGTEEELETMQRVCLWDDQFFDPISQAWASGYQPSLDEYSQAVTAYHVRRKESNQHILVVRMDIQNATIRGVVGFRLEEQPDDPNILYNVAVRLWSLEAEKGSSPKPHRLVVDLLGHVYWSAVDYAKSTMCHDGSTIVATVPDWAPLQNAALRQEFKEDPSSTLVDGSGDTINCYHIS